MRLFLVASLSALALTGGAALSSCATTGANQASAYSEEPVIVATRRLNESQYRATIADLFGPQIEMNGRFEPDQRSHGLLAVGSANLSISSGGFEQYYAMARAVADQSLNAQRRDATMGCKPADPKAPDDACTAEMVRKFGERLFRRPLEDSEVATRVATANRGATQGQDFYAGAKLAMISLLTAPEFLFRVETAEPDPDHRRTMRLDAYSKASRLSYLMWNAAPDADLLEAAKTGAIHTPEGLQAQVTRLAASPRFEAGMRAFFTDMMQLELFDTITKDGATYPKYSSTVANSAKEQTLKTLVDLLLTKKQDYRNIFTTRDTFIDRPLAAIYQLPFLAPNGWEAHHYEESSDRAGILTQVTFLTLFSHPGRSSPTKRGVALNEIFLCEETPTPPPNVDFSIVQDTNNPLLKTVRSRLLAHATDETCAGCHNLTDPIGLSLERFDGVGQFRPAENGEPIDVTAELDGVKFEGADGLGRVLRNNPRVPSCLVHNIFAYGVGRDSGTAWENSYLEAQSKAFVDGGYLVPDMVSRIAASPEFYQVVMPEPPAAPTEQPPAQVAQSNPRGRS